MTQDYEIRTFRPGDEVGILEGFTKAIYSEASSTVIFVVMVIVLVTRPRGLFGKVG